MEQFYARDLHLTRERGRHLLRFADRRRGRDHVLALAVEKVASHGEDQHGQAKAEKHPQEQAQGQSQIRQLDGQRLVGLELLGQGVALAGLGQSRAGRMVLASAEAAPLLLRGSQGIFRVMAEVEAPGREHLGDDLARLG